MTIVRTLLLLFPLTLRADVSLLLHESTGTGAARFTAAGHAAVYFSNICAESAIRLRVCRAGESGAVVSSHPDLGEPGNYEWNASALNVYLYGVNDARQAPLYATVALRRLLQERYRVTSLQSLCPAECAAGDGRWRDMAGQLFMRDIYALRVKTTQAQDEEFIRQFNAAPNVGRYNGFTNNCADFVRGVLNRYFPGAARADRLNDFGMTSPKAISRSFTHFGQKHPELFFTVEKFIQLDGPIRRSSDNRNGTEAGFRSKKWLFPLLLRPPELGVLITAYYATGRFNPEGEFERVSPSDPAAWERYRSEFQSVVARAKEAGLIDGEQELRAFFADLERQSTPGLTNDGLPFVTVDGRRLGLTAGTVLNSESDPDLAARLLMAKVYDALKASRKNRESLAAFEATWRLMSRALDRHAGIIEVSTASQ